MSKDEELALRLVARDLSHMKTVCGAFGGQVLKSTGDGLLMLFTSAVQAVACALEIQRDLQKKNLELPKAEQLRHRIGIHLGDVFQNGGDVMGDGVNIAARLQTEAMPGGICLSKTVYDVVNNRLQFYVNDLGARKLKNIGKVTAYQISPMDDGTGRYRVAWYRWKSMLWGAASLVALVLTLCLVFYLGRHRMWAELHPGQAGSFTIIPVMPPASKSAPSLPVPVPIPAVAPASDTSPAGVTEVSETEFKNTSFHYMLKYDFDGMETWIKLHDWPGKSTNHLAEACPRLEHLVAWGHQQLQNYSMDKPLKVVGKERTVYYWPASFGGMKEKIVPNNSAPKTEFKTVILGPDQIIPMTMHNVLRQLLKDDPEPPDALTVQLEKELHLFIETYHLVFPNRAVAPETGSPTNAVTNPSP
jgi:hypothetical protein